MRGELIDFARTFKKLCSQLLQSMLNKSTYSDEEEDPTKQFFMLKEEDLHRSVYDESYDKYVDKPD